jgi:hypothetical protein
VIVDHHLAESLDFGIGGALGRDFPELDLGHIRDGRVLDEVLIGLADIAAVGPTRGDGGWFPAGVRDGCGSIVPVTSDGHRGHQDNCHVAHSPHLNPPLAMACSVAIQKEKQMQTR